MRGGKYHAIEMMENGVWRRAGLTRRVPAPIHGDERGNDACRNCTGPGDYAIFLLDRFKILTALAAITFRHRDGHPLRRASRTAQPGDTTQPQRGSLRRVRADVRV
jgi:hypothetical protein